MKKKVKRSKNIYRSIWISCIFLVLVVILVMVMHYKIYYEYLEENSLYFYDCDGNLCTSLVSIDDDSTLYSVYECRYEECPVYTSIIRDGYVLLKESDDSYELYNYKDGLVISAGYDGYEFINDNYIIVTKGSKKGIIDIEDNLITSVEYEDIGYYINDILNGYNTEYIIARKGGKYGIISYKTGEVKEGFNYSEDKIEELLLFIEV